MVWSGRAAGGRSSSGAGCISMSTGSSLGQTSLEGCMGEFEGGGDHMMRGEGLVPVLGKRGEL